MCTSFILMPDMALRNRHFSSHVCVLCMCACVSWCVRAWVQHQSETMTRVYCVWCACVHLHMCVSLFICFVQETHHTHKSWVCSRRCGKFTKIMSEKWARFPPPLLKYSRETDYFLVSTVPVTVTRTHAQAYAHAHNLWHAHAAHFNTSAHSHTHIPTHAQNTCMLTHAQMQTHIDTWTHTKMQVIDTKDIDIDALALDFVTNLSLNAE